LLFEWIYTTCIKQQLFAANFCILNQAVAWCLPGSCVFRCS
jgi:hypothetical protein